MTDNDRFDLEEIAAFIEGRLTGEARARVIQQLAQSDAALEVYAEAMRLRTERAGGNVIPLPIARRRRWIYVAPPLAAAAAALLIMTVQTARSSATSSAAALVAAMGDAPSFAAALPPDWDQRTWSVTRGGPARLGEPELAFRLGVRAVDLEVSLRGMDMTRAELLVAEMQGLLRQMSMSQPVVSQYALLGTRLTERDGASAADLPRLAGDAEGALGDFLSSPRFGFGKWCAASELAARARRSGFFESAEFRRVLEERDELDLDDASRESLQRIAAIMDGGVDDAEYDVLEAALGALIQRGAG